MLMYIAAAVAVLIIAAINAAEERNDIKAMSLKITAGISLAVSILVVFGASLLAKANKVEDVAM